MKTENVVLMRMARETLKGRWSLAVSASAIFMAMVFVINAIPAIGSVFSLVLSGPLVFGYMSFILLFSRGENVKLEKLFVGFNYFIETLVTYLLMVLFIFLWSLLFIVPGIIAAIGYSMTFFILADDKSIKPREALRKSKKMMYGYKWKFFCLELRFLGWILLSILTMGVGFLWLAPYMKVTIAKFYDDIKDKSEVSPLS
jgi:uncharacterized membrane protein